MKPTSPIRVDYPDDDLQKRVTTYLASRHFPAFRELNVEVTRGSVTISGRLRSFYEKQVALNSCQRVAGVLELVDHIAVEKPRLPK